MEAQEFDSIAEVGNGGRKETSGEKSESARATWKKPARKLKFTYQEQKDYDTIEQEMADLEDLVCRLDEDILKAATDFVRLNELSKQKDVYKRQEQDKINAYMTLYTALVTTAKAAAPMIPFMTEDIYRNLVCSVDASAPESVHPVSYTHIDVYKRQK